jgi:hypothetical protein
MKEMMQLIATLICYRAKRNKLLNESDFLPEGGLNVMFHIMNI